MGIAYKPFSKPAQTLVLPQSACPQGIEDQDSVQTELGRISEYICGEAGEQGFETGSQGRMVGIQGFSDTADVLWHRKDWG